MTLYRFAAFIPLCLWLEVYASYLAEWGEFSRN